jgi:anti-sigma B factor antagonist
MAGQVRKALTLEVRQAGSAGVVCASGSADIGQCEKLLAALDQLVARRTALIVLDLTDLEFICSQGLGAIITAHLKSRHHKGQIRLVNPQPAVREVLETARLTKLFPIFNDLDQAVRA